MIEQKENIEYELRMYGLVNYQLSDIQKGIQFGHAVVEYISTYKDDPQCNDWVKNWKTFIILNGGTTNNRLVKRILFGPISIPYTVDEDGCHIGMAPFGTMNKHSDLLELNGIKIAKFFEPDLGDQLTSIVFIVDERVFNLDKYPDMSPGDDYDKWLNNIGGSKNEFLRTFLRNFKLA